MGGPDVTGAQFSPDGKWIAYSSDEGGRREVFVRDFAPRQVPATAAGRWQISTAGGDRPRWSADGREIYYLMPDGQLMAVPIKTSPTFQPGTPIRLLETNVTGFFAYDVAADGRFLVNILPEAATPPSPPITVVLTWMANVNE